MHSNPIIIHVPHSSTYIPVGEREKIILPENELQKELLLMTDWYVDELFNVQGFERHINHLSRLVMDPERFRDDQLEEMAGCGMGAIYTHTSDGRPLKTISPEEKERLLTKYYDPYHKQFTEIVEKKLDRHGKCLIFDAHSFSSIPLPYEADKAQPRPDICIGFDDFHSSPGLRQVSYEFFCWGEDMSVEFNRPFSGSIVPSRYYQLDNRVRSIMIEINRSQYIDEKTGVKLEEFKAVKDIIEKYLDFVSGYIKNL